MNPLYIITQADGGGAQKYVLTLAGHFKGTIAAGKEAEKLFQDAAVIHVPVYKLRHLVRNIHPWHDLLAIFEIRALVKKLRPTIVHLNSSKAGFLGSLATVGLKTKVVFTAHGFIFNEPRSALAKNFYRILEKTASLRRDFIITVSAADYESALKNNLIDAKKIKTVHNGIGQINFLPRQDARKILGLDESKIIFGTLSNFYKTKGMDVLIDAVAVLDKKIFDDVQFCLFGNGPEQEQCALQIKNYRLEKTIILPGNIPNASSYLKAFDAFIIPSRKEGFPYALLEAMQAGLPIIASNVGGIKEALGEAGILTKAQDTGALSQAITQLITNPKLRTSLAESALQKSSAFTEEKMLAETKNIYQNL